MVIKVNVNENINVLQEHNDTEQYNIKCSSIILQIVVYNFYRYEQSNICTQEGKNHEQRSCVFGECLKQNEIFMSMEVFLSLIQSLQSTEWTDDIQGTHNCSSVWKHFTSLWEISHYRFQMGSKPNLWAQMQCEGAHLFPPF